MKYSCKLFKENSDATSTYFHKEYMYRSKRAKEDISIILAPYGWLILEIMNDANEKDSVLLTEILARIVMRKSSKFTAMIESYEVGEFDIFDSSTGRLRAGIPGDVDVSYGKVNMKFGITIIDTGFVGIKITINNKMNIDLSISDWLEIMYKLKDIDFAQMNMAAINYIGSPEVGDKHLVDLRKTYDVYDDNIDDMYEIDVTQTKRPPESNSAAAILAKPKAVGKVNTRGW